MCEKERCQGFLFGLGPKQLHSEMGNTWGSGGVTLSIYFSYVKFEILIRQYNEYFKLAVGYTSILCCSGEKLGIEI